MGWGGANKRMQILYAGFLKPRDHPDKTSIGIHADHIVPLRIFCDPAGKGCLI